MSTIIIFVVMIGLIWFMQRSQKKKVQERQTQLNAVTKGDEIVTIGGLYGLIDEVDVDNQKMILDVDGVYLTFELSAIKRIVAKADQVITEEESVEEATTDEVTTETPAVEADKLESAIESKD